MKRIFLLLTMAAVMLSCEKNEMESPYTTAAKEIYNKYAPRENLTVALLGEYKGYNAVMLQAHTDEEWQFICKEFDLDPEKKMEEISSDIKGNWFDDKDTITEVFIEKTLDTKGQWFDDKDTLQFEGLGDLLKMVMEEALDSFEVEVKATADSSVYSHFVDMKNEFESKMDKDQLFDGEQQRMCRFDVDTRTIWVYYYNSFSDLNRITQDLIDTAGNDVMFHSTFVQSSTTTTL